MNTQEIYRQEIINSKPLLDDYRKRLLEEYENVLNDEECSRFVGLSIEEIMNLSKEGKFPDPVKAGVGYSFDPMIHMGWLISDVRKWYEIHKDNEDLKNRKLCEDWIDKENKK